MLVNPVFDAAADEALVVVIFDEGLLVEVQVGLLGMTAGNFEGQAMDGGDGKAPFGKFEQF